MRFKNVVTSRLGVPLIALGMAVVTYVALDQAARFAEVRLDAFLWRKDDTLRLFARHNYVNRKGRLLIYGPSEAREALFPEEMRPALTRLVPYQHAQSIGTLEDGLVILEYLERAYGPAAMPEALLLGITPRFIANVRSEQSPLFAAINRFSPHFTIDEQAHPPRLVPRTLMGAVEARAELLSVQPDRFRRGLFAIAARTATAVVPSLASNRRVWGPVSQAKYLNHRIAPDEALRTWLTSEVMTAVHDWDPEVHREEIVDQLNRLRDYTTRHGVQLFVVNLPEMSWNRDLYDPEHYASYLRIVRTTLGDVPFLDLRTFVPDDQFYDTSHTMWEAGKRVSKRVAAFIETERGHSVQHARTDR